MKRRKRNEIIYMADGNTVLDRTARSKSTLSTNHKTNGCSAMSRMTPYDTGKVKIGIYYEPKHNHHNPDQDWVQKAVLGIESTITTDTVVLSVLFAICTYAVMGLISRSYYE